MKIKEFLNEESKFNYKNLVLLGIIVIFYTILSFINLGTKQAPQSFHEIDNKDGILVTFAAPTDINQIVFYSGRKAGDYRIEYSVDGKEYNDDLTMRASGSFAWDSGKLNRMARYIKIIPQDTNLVMGELAFYDNDLNKLQITIEDEGTTIYTLTDETSTIPEEISAINSSYFDEVYFARSAYEYSIGEKVYDWVHPPLGKLIQAIPIKLSQKMAPFYWRLMGNIAGIIMIIVMYLFGKEMFKKRKYALIAALLMTFDTFHFAQTRMGTIDSFLVLFIMLSYFFMYKYIKNDKTPYFALSGLFFGLASSVKWSGVFAGFGLLIIYIINKVVRKQKISNFILNGLAYFILIPLVIYTLCYVTHPNIENRKVNSIPKIVEQSKDMYNYHAKLEADHPFTSKWYTWPISYKPVWYYGKNMSANTKSTIVGVGNILIWWPAIIAFLILPYYIIKKRNKKSLFLLIAILSNFIPFIFISRIMFLYHYFAVLPFMMLAIVNFFYQINKNNKKDILMYFYTILVIIVFIIYYPCVSGKTTTNEYIDNTKILSSWEY